MMSAMFIAGFVITDEGVDFEELLTQIMKLGKTLPEVKENDLKEEFSTFVKISTVEFNKLSKMLQTPNSE